MLTHVRKGCVHRHQAPVAASAAGAAVGPPPRVSVITPFVNADAYLANAIASVRAQTVTDWELILVDDGSTDGSRLIALQAAEQDVRIRLLDRPVGSARGAAAARNAGLRAGLGEFFAFLDADDMLEPIMLQTVLAAAEAHPEAAMIFGPTQWWYPEERRASWTEPVDGWLAGRLHPPPRLLSRIILMQDGHVPCTCSVLVRRSAIELVGGFEERFRLYEDQALWVKLFLRYPAYVTPICLFRVIGSTPARCRRMRPSVAFMIAWACIRPAHPFSTGSPNTLSKAG